METQHNNDYIYTYIYFFLSNCHLVISTLGPYQFSIVSPQKSHWLAISLIADYIFSSQLLCQFSQFPFLNFWPYQFSIVPRRNLIGWLFLSSQISFSVHSYLVSFPYFHFSFSSSHLFHSSWEEGCTVGLCPIISLFHNNDKYYIKNKKLLNLVY